MFVSAAEPTPPAKRFILVKRALILLVALAVIAAACNEGDAETPTTLPPITTTSVRAGTGTTTTQPPMALGCDGPFPAFPTYLPDDPLDVEGTFGPGPRSLPPAEGQLVAHWLRDSDVVIEMRWPGTALPGSEVEVIPGDAYEARLWPADPEQTTGRVIATITVGDEPSDPCSLLSIEAYAPRPEPIYDELFGFVSTLRPVAERSEYVAAVLAAQTQVAGSDREPGRCAEPIPTDVDEFGHPDEAATQLLAESFLEDRLAGRAAEQCLAVSALQRYEQPDLASVYPGPCLFSCDGEIVFTGAELASVTDDRASLLVTYRVGDGSDVQLRESLLVAAVPDAELGHVVLIEDVWMQPDSYVDEATARRVVEDMLDALAARDYDMVAAYLVNEGYSQEVEERLGDLFTSPPSTLFAAFCPRATCGAAYEIGETVALDEWSRTLRVSFDTTEGVVASDISVGMFEGIATASNLPPDGRPAGTVARVDERIFGQPYVGSLIVVRYAAVERIRGGTSEWVSMWRARSLTHFAVAGDALIEGRRLDMGGGVYRLRMSDGASDLIAAAPFELAGAGTAADRPVVLVTDGSVLDVVDLATGTQSTLLDFTGYDESVYAADVANGVLLLTLGVGESVWFDVYEFDEVALTAGDLLTRIDAEGALGIGHLSPDGSTIATTYDDSFYDPVQTVALLGTRDGRVLGRWTVAAPDTIADLDFDGRWIVADLGGGGLFVIDTESADVRRVDTSVRVRFG